MLVATGLAVSSVLVYPWVFPTEQDRAALSTTIGANPALGLIFGPANDLSTADGFTAWRSLALGGFLAALGAIFTVTRATRGQEDSGQAELLAAGVLGRASRLSAAAGLALAGSLLLGLVAGLVTIAAGGSGESSMLLGATFTATGWMFAAGAAVTAQIGSDARTANAIAVAVLGSLFLLRGVAYSLAAPTWTIWINPLGWTMETQPAHANRWWPLLFALLLSAALLAAAFALQARRDFGQGAIAARPGPARGTIRSTGQLAVRLSRGPLIAWTIAFLILGVTFGYFTTSIKDVLVADQGVARILAAGATTPDALVAVFLVTILSLVGILAAVPGVLTVVKVRREEMDDRVEPILATRVHRTHYYAANVLLGLGASTAYVLFGGTIIALLAATADIGIGFGQALEQVVVSVPAVWTVVALSVAVIGARPRVAMAAWAGVLVSFVLTLLGPTFGLPDWALGISPFWHIPHVTEADPAWIGLLWVALATAVFLAAGFAGFNRRDLAR